MTQSQESPKSGPAAVAAPQRRLLSLDVFRGITIAGMLLVNNAGDWDHIFQPL
jgi:predicted acyltransferase